MVAGVRALGSRHPDSPKRAGELSQRLSERANAGSPDSLRFQACAQMKLREAHLGPVHDHLIRLTAYPVVSKGMPRNRNGGQ